MRSDLLPYLGRTVPVVIDRPLGTKHPRHEIWYTLNYGYIPDTVSGDGEPIDVYLVGHFTPVECATGRVIAVILREDDHEDKLVVAPPGVSYTREQIAALVEFQERFFRTQVIPLNKSERGSVNPLSPLPQL